jgi:hypothetical protein
LLALELSDLGLQAFFVGLFGVLINGRCRRLNFVGLNGVSRSLNFLGLNGVSRSLNFLGLNGVSRSLKDGVLSLDGLRRSLLQLLVLAAGLGLLDGDG